MEKSPLPFFFVEAEATVFHLALSLNLVNKCTLEVELSVQLFLRIIKTETKGGGSSLSSSEQCVKFYVFTEV